MAGDGPIRRTGNGIRDLALELKLAFFPEPANPLAAAWLLEGRRNAARGRWQVYIVPSMLAAATLILTIAVISLRPVSSQSFVPIQQGYNYYVKLTPFFSLFWALPLVYGAVRDALSALGHRHAGTGGWQGLLAQLKDAPLPDSVILAALTRITWPRLAAAALGSAVLFWVLMLCCAWPVRYMHQLYYSQGDLFVEILLSGWKIILLLGLNGLLAALCTVLCCITVGRGLPGSITPAIGAVIYCFHSLQLATVSLNADHWPRGYHLPLNHIIPALGGILIIWGLVLALGGAAWPVRRFMAVAWLPLFSTLSWVVSFATEFIRPAGIQTPQQLYSFILLQASWLMSTLGLLNPGIYPGILEVNNQASITQLAGSYDHMNFIAGYCCVLLAQAVLVVALAHFALGSVRQWRMGEG